MKNRHNSKFYALPQYMYIKNFKKIAIISIIRYLILCSVKLNLSIKITPNYIQKEE
nr:MAG TPA: hypothetical protein [Caudoviricetes sp.]